MGTGVAYRTTVDVTTLDRALSSLEMEGPCLLKIDVQGFESAVLAGASEVLESVDDYWSNAPSFRSMTAKP